MLYPYFGNLIYIELNEIENTIGKAKSLLMVIRSIGKTVVNGLLFEAKKGAQNSYIINALRFKRFAAVHGSIESMVIQLP